jgi:hypothetical protein
MFLSKYSLYRNNTVSSMFRSTTPWGSKDLASMLSRTLLHCNPAQWAACFGAKCYMAQDVLIISQVCLRNYFN